MSDSEINQVGSGEHGPMSVKEVSFSFWWENLEAVVEWLEAIPDKGNVFVTIDTERLKEAVIDGFEYAFSEAPLTHLTLNYSGFAIGIHGCQLSVPRQLFEFGMGCNCTMVASNEELQEEMPITSPPTEW